MDQFVPLVEGVHPTGSDHLLGLLDARLVHLDVHGIAPAAHRRQLLFRGKALPNMCPEYGVFKIPKIMDN